MIEKLEQLHHEIQSFGILDPVSALMFGSFQSRYLYEEFGCIMVRFGMKMIQRYQSRASACLRANLLFHLINATHTQSVLQRQERVQCVILLRLLMDQLPNTVELVVSCCIDRDQFVD